MFPGVDLVPLAGSYNSAVAGLDSSGLIPPPYAPRSRPPTTRTRPSRSRTAACSERGVPMVPVAIQAPPGPAAGSGLADGSERSLGPGDVAGGDAVAIRPEDGGTGGGTDGNRRVP